MQCYAQRKNDILSARYPELPDESHNDIVAPARAKLYRRKLTVHENAATRRAAKRAQNDTHAAF
jgi:hypothetical protein